jgi:hypothetical protein
MKKLLIVFISLIAFVKINAQDKVVVNDPNAQIRNVTSFNEISVAGGIDLYLSPDDKEAVVVSAAER